MLLHAPFRLVRFVNVGHQVVSQAISCEMPCGFGVSKAMPILQSYADLHGHNLGLSRV